MPSSYTPNFNLNQWEAHDKVERIDFNADNAKIDAALTCHPSAELIGGVTATAEVKRLELDISNVDWGRYMVLVLMFNCASLNGIRVTMDSGYEQCAYVSSAIPSISSHDYLTSLNNSSHITMLIPVFYDGSNAVSALAFGAGMPSALERYGQLSGGGGQKALNECKTMTLLRTEGAFDIGDHGALWGVK